MESISKKLSYGLSAFVLACGLTLPNVSEARGSHGFAGGGSVRIRVTVKGCGRCVRSVKARCGGGGCARARARCFKVSAPKRCFKSCAKRVC